MSLLCCTNLIFISLYFSVVLSAKKEVCGQVNTKQLLNSQTDTQIDEFPWMARIAHQHSKTRKITFPCQAVLITQQHLLTAAPCLLYFNGDNDPYAVLLGDWNTTNDFDETDCDFGRGKCSTPYMIDIDDTILYPTDSLNDPQNDISIIRLTKEVTYSDFIRPICLPSNDDKNKEFGSEKVLLTGWLTSAKGPKQKTSIFIFNLHDCRRKNADITDKNLCGDVCDADETYMPGSALMDVKDPESKSSQSVYLIGLLSYGVDGKDRCMPGVPDIFVRVDKYLDWIKENIPYEF